MIQENPQPFEESLGRQAEAKLYRVWQKYSRPAPTLFEEGEDEDLLQDPIKPRQFSLNSQIVFSVDENGRVVREQNRRRKTEKRIKYDEGGYVLEEEIIYSKSPLFIRQKFSYRENEEGEKLLGQFQITRIIPKKKGPLGRILKETETQVANFDQEGNPDNIFFFAFY